MHNLVRSKIVWLLVMLVALAVVWQMGLIPTWANDKYQAVFLTNNQVYFGKLSNLRSEYPVLKEVYYLRVTQTLQPRDPSAPTQQLQLVKLGNELHGPEDAMRINKSQILFVEDLKADSQVVNAINEYQKSQSEPNR